MKITRLFLARLGLILLLQGMQSTIANAQIEHFEDFENYLIDVFPSPLWRDVREISIPVTAPNPSAKVIETLNSDSTITRALQFEWGVTTSCGIFQEIDTSQIYYLSADIRIDKWSNSTQAFFTEWAVAIGIFSLRPGWDFNGTPQITFVAQPVAENWVLYALRSDASPSNYFNLEYTNSHVALDTWYQVEFTLDDHTGIVHTKVTEKTSGMVTHEAMTAIPNWTPGESGNYLYYGAWDGEYNTNASSGNQATIDNFRFQNELPTSIAEERQRPGFYVFPNPATDEIFIDMTGFDQKEMELQLLDSSGNILDKIAIKEFGLLRHPVEKLPSGTYTLRAVTNGRLVSSSIPFVKI